MKQGRRVPAIAWIGLLVALVLGATGWGIVNWMAARSQSHLRSALWQRGTQILGQNDSTIAMTTVRDLFGGDIDGICTVWNGPANEAEMRGTSPAKFDSAITAVVKWQRDTSATDGDLRHWLVFAVKDGAVLRRYDLVLQSMVDIYRTDGSAERCFDPGTPAQLNLYSELNGENKSLIIKIPAEFPAAP